MFVHVYSLKKRVFHAEAKSVNAKTVSGDITILDNHRPLIAPLAPAGLLRILMATGETQTLDYRGGFLEVRLPSFLQKGGGGEVNILLN